MLFSYASLLMSLMLMALANSYLDQNVDGGVCSVLKHSYHHPRISHVFLEHDQIILNYGRLKPVEKQVRYLPEQVPKTILHHLGPMHTRHRKL